jgi:hypothetical protein
MAAGYPFAEIARENPPHEGRLTLTDRMLQISFQTPRKSSARVMRNPRAIFSIFISDRFRSPRSIPPI